MSVSTNQLFHFTNKKSLLNILKHNFVPYYSLERIFSELELAIPMVSFCDIPLTQTAEQTGVYGDYAIGLSKEWGINNKLNPVFYYCENSILNNKMKEIFINDFYNAYKNGGFQPAELPRVKRFLNYIYYSKPYEGSNWDKIHKKFNSKKRCLYNEREWRYIPEESNETPLVNFISKEIFTDEKNMESLNNKMKEKKLCFNPGDIRYIIIKKESEIPEMIDKLNRVNDNYSSDEIKILTTRIITRKQIRDDF